MKVMLKHQCLIFSPVLNGYWFLEAAGAFVPFRVWMADSMAGIYQTGLEMALAAPTIVRVHKDE